MPARRTCASSCHPSYEHCCWKVLSVNCSESHLLGLTDGQKELLPKAGRIILMTPSKHMGNYRGRIRFKCFGESASVLLWKKEKREENTGEEKRGRARKRKRDKRACDMLLLPPSPQALWLKLLPLPMGRLPCPSRAFQQPHGLKSR